MTWHHGCHAQVQTLLFSATLPSWVKDITRRFLQPGHKLVDLVGTDKMKVRGLPLRPSWMAAPVCLLHAAGAQPMVCWWWGLA